MLSVTFDLFVGVFTLLAAARGDAAGAHRQLGAACPDADLDGWADCRVIGCDPAGLSCGDCDDGAAARHPGATESCDHRDDDCDGRLDEGFPALTTVHKIHDAAFDGYYFGRWLAGIGDVSGDGVTDLAVGYPGDQTYGAWRGSVVVVSGADRSVLYRAHNDAAGSNEQLGAPVVAMGDLNADGVPDFAAAAYLSDAAAADAGEVIVFSGSDGAVLRHCLDPNAASADRLGEENALARLDDITGDGVPEVLAGASRANPSGLQDAGKAVVFSGATCAVVRTLTDPGGAAGDFLGLSVAGMPDVTGDGIADIAVGEPYDHHGAADAGSVLIFSGSDGALVRRILDPSPATGDYLGWSLAAAGDLDDDGVEDLVSGARQRDTALGQDRGAVEAFSGSDGSLLWRGADPAGLYRDSLGWSVASIPDTDMDGVRDVLAGAPYATESGKTNAGRALLFSGADGSFIRSFVDPDAAASDLAGLALAGPGDLNGDGAPDIVVGQPYDDVAKHGGDRGAVLIFYAESDCDADGEGPTGSDCDDGDASVHDGAFEACDSKDNDCDGAVDEDEDGDAYGICEEEAACDPADWPSLDPGMHPGAPERCNGLDDDCDGVVDDGPDADGDAWASPCDCDDGSPSIHPGAAEACNHVADGCGAVDAGFTHVTTRETIGDRHAVAGDRFGWSVAAVGDVDGDRVSDFAAGAPTDDMTGWDTGVVTMYSGADRRVLWRTSSTTSFLNLGVSLAATGDLDGDGKPDLASGSPTANAVVLLSGATGREIARCVDSGGGGVGDLHGLAGWVDVTGDGVPEILAGAATNSQRLHQQGKGIVFTYDRTQARCSILFELWDPDAVIYDNLGSAVAGVGDLTGDGVPDIIVGEPGDDSLADNNGAILVFSGADGSFARRLLDPQAAYRDNLGSSVAGIEDLDGDGWPEILAGSERLASWTGGVVVFSGFDGTVLRRLADPDGVPGDRLAWSLAVTDDVDGDGLDDVVGGAYYASHGSAANCGHAVVLSSATGAKLLSLRNATDVAGAQFGYAVAAAGDLSGDGVPEILVGAPYESRAAGAETGSFSIFSLESECDGDGAAPFAGDCDDADSSVWAWAGEATGLLFASDKRTITWQAPVEPGGLGNLRYDMLRSDAAGSFLSAICLETDGSDCEADDPALPAVGGIYFYLVRAQNACGGGDLGTWGPDDWPRVGRSCP